MRERILILHNLRSAHNVGSIFRTADAAGVTRLYLTGITPTPTDRFGRIRPALTKVALGAEKSVRWEYRADARALVDELTENGVRVVAVEQDARAVAYEGTDLHTSHAFIFGNEVTGLPEDILAASDAIVEIPMRGAKESLNVAVAAGIILFSAILRR